MKCENSFHSFLLHFHEKRQEGKTITLCTMNTYCKLFDFQHERWVKLCIFLLISLFCSYTCILFEACVFFLTHFRSLQCRVLFTSFVQRVQMLYSFLIAVLPFICSFTNVVCIQCVCVRFYAKKIKHYRKRYYLQFGLSHSGKIE